MARANLTLLVIDTNVAIRADFEAGRTVRMLNAWRNARPDADDLTLLVEATAHDGGRLRGAIWVVWSDLFAQTLRLDAKSMGLKGDELRAGLAFEAEPLSGINGLDSLIAYEQTSATAGEREFWVLQAGREDIENLRDAIARLGGRLAGVTSPLGLSVEYPVAGSTDEVWNKWLTSVAELMSAAAQVSAKNRLVAIAPPKRPMGPAAQAAIAAALTVCVLLGCLLHYKLIAEPTVARLRSEIKTSQDAKTSLDTLDKQITQANTKKGETLRSIEYLKKSVNVVSVQRDRLAGLLALVAQERPEEIVILSIEDAGGDPTLHGLAMKSHLAVEFAHNIGERSLALGWQPQTPRSHARNQLPTGGPWSFELQFKDVLATGDAFPEPKSTKKAGK